MKLTDKHAMFYTSKKLSSFYCNVSIHDLINSQINLNKNYIDKHNDLVIISSLYKRCRRNNLNLLLELTKLYRNSECARPNRARMCKRIIKKLQEQNYLNKFYKTHCN